MDAVSELEQSCIHARVHASADFARALRPGDARWDASAYPPLSGGAADAVSWSIAEGEEGGEQAASAFLGPSAHRMGGVPPLRIPSVIYSGTEVGGFGVNGD